MLNLQARSHLHVMGEVVDRTNFLWTAAPNTEYDHDFAEDSLRETPAADAPSHRRRLQRLVDVHDPARSRRRTRPAAAAVHQVGRRRVRPAGRRARLPDGDPARCRDLAHGFDEKDDAIDWQAYFHARNRLVVAALHWDGDVKGLVRRHLKATLKHLSCLDIRPSPFRTRRSTTSWPAPSTSSRSWNPACPRCTGCARNSPTRWSCRCWTSSGAVAAQL